MRFSMWTIPVAGRETPRYESGWDAAILRSASLWPNWQNIRSVPVP